MQYLWIGIGGFVGANARYIVGRFISGYLGTSFPWGTGIVNLTGAFLVGVLVTLLTDWAIDDPMWRQLLVIGFLGGYTTFSSYTFEAVSMTQDGQWIPAMGYVIGSNVLGLIACFSGIWIVRAIGL